MSPPALQAKSRLSSTRSKAGNKTSRTSSAAQGGIFEARFDNELLGNKGTVGADVAAMIKGLQTHNVALVTAAAEGLHDNAMDFSGNNAPVNGGTYNPDGQTVADALSTATPPLPPAPVTSLIPSSPAGPGARVAAGEHSAATSAAAPEPQFHNHHAQQQHHWDFG